MASQGCCSAGCNIFMDWVIPEGMIHRRLGPFYKENPIMARVIATPIALICGVAKVVLFPVACLLALLVLPIYAIIRSSPPNKGDGGDVLKAWLFSFMGLVAYAALLTIPIFSFNLVTTTGLFIGVIAFSVVFHVYKFVKEPEPLEEPGP